MIYNNNNDNDNDNDNDNNNNNNQYQLLYTLFAQDQDHHTLNFNVIDTILHYIDTECLSM